MSFDVTKYQTAQGHGGWTIIHHHKFLENEARFVNDKDFLGMYFCFVDELKYDIKGFQSGTMLGLHYGLVYIPKGLCELVVPAGLYESFLIQFDPGYLRCFVGGLPMLQRFLSKAETITPVSISPKPLLATPRMISDILRIMNNENKLRGKLKDMYINSKVPEILLNCIAHVHRQFREQLTDRDIVKLKKAHEYVEAHFDYEYTVEKIADIVFMDHNRLREGFKLLYGEPFDRFVCNMRMKKAIQLLSETDLPLKKVAAGVGYRRTSSFTKTFKRKYGDLPETFRHKEIN